jgi:peptide deformylase
MDKALREAKNPKGVGLAAPQIGESYQIFLMWPEHNVDPLLFINPEILESSQRQQSPLDTHLPKDQRGVYEGCLSIPHHYAPLSRSMSVTVKYLTSPLAPLLNSGEGNKRGEVEEKTETFTSFPAHIVQHEVDHLNCILFVDRVLQQNTKLYKVEGKTWTEITL